MFQKGGHRYSPPLGYKININIYLLFMNTIIKEAKEILKKKTLKEIKENSPEYYKINLANLLEKNQINIYYENIDWLTAEIKEINQNITNIITNLLKSYNHKREIENNEKHIEFYDNIKILDKFYLINLWVVFGWQLQVYWLYDWDKNKLWSFVYKIPTIVKNNYNAFTSLELTWLFFKSYQNYFDWILEYFWVDRQSNKILKRLDYCMDLKNIEVPEILEYLKELHQRQRIKDYNWLTKTDLQRLQERNYAMKFWKTETWKKFINNSNTLIIYDKILDIADNYLKRQIDWKNPYQDYLDSDLPITRIELKKTTSALSKIWDYSINTMLQRIRPLFFDYLKKYFTCDFSLLTWQKVSLNWKKIYLAKEKKEKNILHSFQMAKSYLKNIEVILWKKAVYKFLFELYPEIEKTSSLDVMDEFELYDFLHDLFPDIKQNEYKNKNK